MAAAINPKLLGHTIMSFRAAAGVSRANLAVAIGKSRSTLSAYENGHALPPLDILAEIARVVGIPLPFFFRGEEVTSMLTDDNRAGFEMLEKELVDHFIALRERFLYSRLDGGDMPDGEGTPL